MTNYSGNKQLNTDCSQGSGLGPMYLSIIDLFLIINCLLCKYTDNTQYCTKIEAENAMMWFNSNMVKAKPGNFQIIFLCLPKYIEPFPDIFSVSDIEIKTTYLKNK